MEGPSEDDQMNMDVVMVAVVVKGVVIVGVVTWGSSS